MPGPARIQLALVDQSTSHLSKMDEYISAGMETAIDIAQDLISNETRVDNPQVTDLEEIMLDYCRMDRDRRQFLQAMEKVKKEALTLDPAGCQVLEEMLETQLKQLAADNTDEQLRVHEKYLDFMEKVNSGAADEEESVKNAEAAQTELSEDTDVAVTQQEIVTKCPFTGLEMEHPVRNKHCQHNYDRDGISAFIKSRGKRSKCPVSGCMNANPLVMADLEENRQLKQIIDKKNRAGKRTTSKKK